MRICWKYIWNLRVLANWKLCYIYAQYNHLWFFDQNLSFESDFLYALGTIHKQRWQIFWIFDTPFPHVDSFLIQSIGNFDQFLTPSPPLPIADVVHGPLLREFFKLPVDVESLQIFSLVPHDTLQGLILKFFFFILWNFLVIRLNIFPFST